MDYLKHGLRWKEYQQRKRAEFGDKFDPSCLYEKWVPAFCTGERIRVRDIFGSVMTGTVGVTTGWRPSFILLPRSDSRGGSILLDNNYVFTSDKVARYTRQYQKKV